MVDDFEDGEYSILPAWWRFDRVSPEVTSVAGGSYALYLKGASKGNWYVGGMGVYFAQPNKDLSSFRNLEMDVYGFGPGRGTLKIELFDDDNGNWEIEQNAKEAFAPLYDDRFVTEMKIDWTGWKHVVLPLAEFKDDNQNVGDNTWNIEQGGESGGLLQLQFICISSAKKGSLQFMVDNIKFTR